MNNYMLKKEFWICCSHRLHSDKLTEEENKEVFGRCNNLPSHGHNYKIIVGIRGQPDERTGMIINFNKIKEVFNKHIDDVYDHQCLNNCPGFEDKVASAENMCKIFFDILKPHIKGLNFIEIYETEGASAVYTVSEK